MTRLYRWSLIVVALAFLHSRESAAQPLRVQAYTAEQLDSLLSDLTGRSANPPTDQFQIFQERNWINDQLARVKSQIVEYSKPNSLVAQSAGLRSKLGAIRNGIGAVSTDATKFNDFVALEIAPFVSELEAANYRDDYDATARVVSSLERSPLKGVVFGGENSPTITAENLPNAVAYLQEKFLPLADSAVDELERHSQELTNERGTMIDKLHKVETAFEGYRSKVTEIQSKLETKASLSMNLYFVIFAIGALSLIAIGLVRLFPEPVMTEWVASGQVIQFVTVMILISAIMALGLAGILTDNTLGTLLGGIGGYVLSQGIGRSVARTTTEAIRTMGMR